MPADRSPISRRSVPEWGTRPPETTSLAVDAPAGTRSDRASFALPSRPPTRSTLAKLKRLPSFAGDWKNVLRGAVSFSEGPFGLVDLRTAQRPPLSPIPYNSAR